MPAESIRTSLLTLILVAIYEAILPPYEWPIRIGFIIWLLLIKSIIKLDTSLIDLMEWFIVDLPKPGKSINVILYLFLISLIIGLKISLFDPHPCRKIISWPFPNVS